MLSKGVHINGDVIGDLSPSPRKGERGNGRGDNADKLSSFISYRITKDFITSCKHITMSRNS